MRWARKPGAMRPQNSETRKSQILMLCAPYFRVPHTQHWDRGLGGVGWGGEEPLRPAAGPTLLFSSESGWS